MYVSSKTSERRLNPPRLELLQNYYIIMKSLADFYGKVKRR